MKKSIAWVDGKWGVPETLVIPLKDRGLQFGDGVFETILILNKQPQLIQAHLKRWQKSAAIMGMDSPPREEWLTPLVNEAIDRIELKDEHASLRLNWSRGNNYQRGIDIPIDKKLEDTTHRFWLELNASHCSFTPVKVLVSENEFRNASSRISLCKTFNYSQSISARYEALSVGLDDALMQSTTGELCCSTTANIFIKRNNQWITPRLKSGCLPGIMREQALKRGIVKEDLISRNPKENDEWILINSLSCHPVVELDGKSMKRFPDAQEFWLSLLAIA